MSGNDDPMDGLVTMVVQAVHDAGRGLTAEALIRGAGIPDATREASSVRLALERAVGERRLEKTLEGAYRPHEPPKKRRIFKNGANMKHPLKRRGLRIRRAVIKLMEERADVMQVADIYRSLPDGLRPGTIRSFRAQMARLLEEDAVIRIDWGWYVLPEHEAVGRATYDAYMKAFRARQESDRKKREAKRVRTRGPHRLHRRGRRHRRAVAKVLFEMGRAVRSRDAYAAVPSGKRPDTPHAFRHLLHKMADEGLAVRLGQGWYCHAEHEAVARIEYEAYRASRRHFTTREEMHDAMVRRREAIVDILEEVGEAVRAKEIFEEVKRRGFPITLKRFRNDIYDLHKDGTIVREGYGRYRVPPKTKPTP